MNWERLDLLGYIGLRQYLDPKRFSVLPGKSHDLCINFKGLIWLTGYGALNLRECSWRPVRNMELKTAMDMH